MYADDLLLLSPSVCGLQCMIDICTRYALDHCLIFNTKKTASAVVGRHKSALSNLTMANDIIKWSDSFMPGFITAG